MPAGGLVIIAGHPTLLFLLLLYWSGYAYSDAKSSSSSSECYSSCGSLPNISYPFRLKDDPKGCGLKRLELTCEDNRTILNLLEEKYYVLDINYKNETIRVVDVRIDQRNCSSLLLPSSRLADLLLNESPGYVFNPWSVVLLVNCERPIKYAEQNTMNQNYYIDLAAGSNSSCFNNYSPLRRNHWYMLVCNYYAEMSEVVESCTVEGVVPVVAEPFLSNRNVSLLDIIHSAMANGFELYYWNSPCRTDRSYFHCA